MIRTVVADDSPTVRQVLREILEEEGDIRVVAEAADGGEAIRLVQETRPDLVVMDVHMPVCDGLEATREIMARVPTPILIVSAVNRHDVDLSLTATQAGALLALPKPVTPKDPRFPQAADELRRMARAMAHVKVVRRWSRPERPAPAVRLARGGATPSLIALAASTGGPPALKQVLEDLRADESPPIVVVQHIARDFSAGFADWLGKGSPFTVKVAIEGEPVVPGSVYVAPDDRHMGVTPDGRIELSGAPPISGFRPSATWLFERCGRAYRSGLVAVIMTGMGTDGADGLEIARAAGARVLAQDQASSVVFGMAREAIRRGIVDAVLPLDRIAPRLRAMMERADER